MNGRGGGRRALLELVGLTSMAAVLLGGLLVAGQAARLSAMLGGATLATWLRLVGLGVIGLGEVLLPVAGLVGAALAFGRWRTEGHLTALWSLGQRPARVLAPVTVLGVALGGLTAMSAHAWGPRALAGLAEEVTVAAAAMPWHGGLRLPGDAGVLRGVTAVDGTPGELWAVLGAGADTPPTLVRARAAEMDAEGRLALRDVHLWSPGARAVLDEVRLSDEAPLRLPGALRPPNTHTSAALDPLDPTAAGSLYRRSALAALAPVLTLLGALLGGALGRTPALLGGAAAMGLAYWGLRLGAVGLRAGDLAPVVAGWLPLALVAPAVAITAAALWPRWRT